MNGKFCNLRWYLIMGKGAFTFIRCDKDGNELSLAEQTADAAPTKELFDELTSKLTDLWISLGYKDNWDREFGKQAAELAASKGWTVVENDFAEGKFLQMREAEMTSDEVAEFKQRLYAGYVHFKYRKVGKPAKINARTGVVTPEVIGEIREAWGTLNPAIIEHTIEQVEAAEKKQHIPNDTVIVYFDRDAVDYRTGQQGAYRCFKKTLFEGYID